MEQIKGFIFKYHFMWVGWLYRPEQNENEHYWDDNLYSEIKPAGIIFMTFAFTRGRAIAKLEKWFSKNLSN